ncbi:unnamed protein product [Hapterophycus canaliculatus]
MAGPTSGCTVVTVIGRGFLNSSELSCAFGTVSTPGIFVNSYRVLCRAPALREQKDLTFTEMEGAPVSVALRVSNNGLVYSDEDLRFLFAPGASLSAVSPRVVSVEDAASGNAAVTISGTGFVHFFEGSDENDSSNSGLVATNTTCRFSDIGDALAVVLRPTVISCRLPAISNTSAGTITVTVSLNGHDFPTPDSGRSLALVMAPRAFSVFPVTGPSSGGTVAQVFGDGYDGGVDPLVCTFQFSATTSVNVPAEYDGRGFVHCTTPPLPSMENESYNTTPAAEGGMVFAYFATPTISEITPESGSPGTLVDVWGEGFLDTAGLLCRFGDTTVAPVRFKARTAVTCKAPRQTSDVTDVPVEVSNNMVDWTSAGMTFRYRPRAVIDSITPKVGPVNGSTIVRVAGSNFPTGNSNSGTERVTSTLSCRFGSTQVPATAASAGANSEVFCVSPTTDRPGSVSLEIVEKGLDVTNSGWRFDYELDVDVTEVYPLFGPEDGGTAVTITGPDFTGSETAVCQFGDKEFRVAGRWVERTSFACDTPPQRPGSVQLAISTNGQQFTDVGLAFAFQPRTIVHSVSPRSGSVHGGTQIAVSGVGFFNSTEIACRLADRAGEATYVNPTLVLCRAPRVELADQHTASYSVCVMVANNGVDFTAKDHPGAMFEYVPSLELLSIEPSGGPTTGGTILRVEGMGFGTAENVSCVVDGLTIDAIVEDREVLVCVTPPMATTGLVQVRLTSNGAEITSPAATFRYPPPPAVLAV